MSSIKYIKIVIDFHCNYDMLSETWRETMNIFDEIISDKDYPDHPIGKVIRKPTLLSKCGTRVTIDKKDRYDIAIEDGEFLVVNMGFSANKAGARFTHPNIAATSKSVHEFKHYRNNGSKFWTSRAGINHYFVIPRNKITLLPEKGYSYIKAEINGVKVSFNVSSGGTNGWTDFLRTFTSTSVNHKLSDLKKVAEVAVRNSHLEPIPVKQLDEHDEARWNILMAKATPDIKEKIAKMIKEGKRPVIHFLTGYSYDGERYGQGKSVYRRYKKVKTSETSYRLEETGALKYIILDLGYGCRAKVTQIDWYKTGKENQLIA